MTLTEAQQKAIRDVLDGMPVISAGIGARKSACSVGAINLGLTGEPTYKIPDSMSKVIRELIIGARDRMPADMRNSAGWRELFPLAAGTGRDRESERLGIIMGYLGYPRPRSRVAKSAAGYTAMILNRPDLWRDLDDPVGLILRLMEEADDRST